jgi:protein-tyrosine-phosphatase
VVTQGEKTVLFLCTGNYYRSRFAEILFNSMAQKRGLAYRASSRALALERGVNNFGPMAISAIQALDTLGIQAVVETTRYPAAAMREDFEKAEIVVALKKAEHLPLLQERFPAWIEKVEFWHVEDDPEALKVIEVEIARFAARLTNGS